jgi:hypothetical protein
LALGLPAPVGAADSPLSQIPAETAVLFHVRGVERTRDRLHTMVKHAVPDLTPQTWDTIDPWMAKIFDPPVLKCLPKDGSLFVAVFEPAEGVAEYAAILQVTSYAAFRDAALKPEDRKTLKADPAGYEQVRINDRELYLLDRAEYAVATPSKALALRLAKRPVGLDGTLPADLAGRLLDADAAVFLNAAALNKTHAEQIKQFRQAFEKMGLSANLSGAQKSSMEMARRVAGPVFQGLADTQAVVASFDFRPDGLKLRVDASAGKGSKSNTLLEDFKSSAFAELSKLPAGALGYVGVEVDSKLFRDLLPFMLGFLDDPKSQGGRAYAQALRALGAAEPGSMVECFTVPASGLTVWNCQYPDKASAAQLELMKHLKAGNVYTSRVIKGEPEITADAKTYRGFKLHSASFTWDLDAMIDQGADGRVPTDAQKQQTKDAMKRLVGERVNYWFGSNGTSVVTLADDNWEAARKRLDLYLDGKLTIADEKDFRETREHLPARATVIGLMDARRYAELIADFVHAFDARAAGRPPTAASSRAPAGKASFLGVAVTLKSERASFELWIPVTAVGEFRSALRPFFEAADQREKPSK